MRLPSRRRFLQAGGALAGAAAVGAAGSQLAGLTGQSRAAAATGTIADLKHVVILMQENRSFDHYFGPLRGVRGSGDKQVLKYQNGTTIFAQPDSKRTDLGYLLPFHMDSSKVNAQNAGDLDHSWEGDHSARANGLWNNWVPAKTEQQLARQGAVQPWQKNAGTPLGPNHVNHVLAQFIGDCAAGTVPQVSWIVAPYEYSEHPAASPSYGAHYTRTARTASSARSPAPSSPRAPRPARSPGWPPSRQAAPPRACSSR